MAVDLVISFLLSPFFFAEIFLVPWMVQNGYIEGWRSFISFTTFVFDNFMLIGLPFTLLSLLVAPIYIYRRYDVFHKST